MNFRKTPNIPALRCTTGGHVTDDNSGPGR